MSRPDAIRARLATLSPAVVEIVDESARHAGHAQAGGGGHFQVTVVSDAFTGLPTLARHRLVYQALDDLIRSGEIHAVSIRAYTTQEFPTNP